MWSVPHCMTSLLCPLTSYMWTHIWNVRDYRPPPPYKWDPHFYGILRSLDRLIGFVAENVYWDRTINMETYGLTWPPLWSSGQSFWLHIQRSRVRSPALPDFLSSNGSGTGVHSASWGQLRSYLNKKSSGSRSRKHRLTAVGGPVALTTWHPSIRKSWH